MVCHQGGRDFSAKTLQFRFHDPCNGKCRTVDWRWGVTRSDLKVPVSAQVATRAEILKKLVNNKYLSLNKKTQIITPTYRESWFMIPYRHLSSHCWIPNWRQAGKKAWIMWRKVRITPEEYMTKLTHFIQSRTSGVLGLRNQYIIKDSFERVAPIL